MSQEGLKKAAIVRKAKACVDCPFKRGISAEAPKNQFHQNSDAVKVRVSCGACGAKANNVKPPMVTSHTNCDRFKRAA